jgi:hypothetical protein
MNTQLDPGESPLPEPFACQFCDAPAAAACPRCGALYCPAHGDSACDACSDPTSGLPSPVPVRMVAVGLVLGSVAALVLLIRPPRLPGEHASSATPIPAAVTATSTRPQTQATRPASGSPAGTAASVAASPAAAAEKYVVKPGDTLGQIAVQYGTTVDALRAANPGINEAALQIGQEILIPPR